MTSKNHRARRLVGAYEWSICHYCQGHATTEDHIVPRAAFPVLQSQLPPWYRIHNVVPACKNCNNDKGHARSDCECNICTWAWTVGLKYFVKPDFEVVIKKIVLAA